jgi:hypothetical protein
MRRPIEIGFSGALPQRPHRPYRARRGFRFADGSAPTRVMDASEAGSAYVLLPMRVCEPDASGLAAEAEVWTR